MKKIVWVVVADEAIAAFLRGLRSATNAGRIMM